MAGVIFGVFRRWFFLLLLGSAFSLQAQIGGFGKQQDPNDLNNNNSQNQNNNHKKKKPKNQKKKNPPDQKHAKKKKRPQKIYGTRLLYRGRFHQKYLRPENF